MKITNVLFKKNGSNEYIIWLFKLNRDNKLLYFDIGEKQIVDRLKTFDLDMIQAGDKIINAEMGESLPILFVKKNFRV